MSFQFRRISLRSVSNKVLSINRISFAPLFQGDYIWIEPVSGREFDVAIGARVISAEGRRIQVRDDDGNEQWLTPERRIKAMHASSVQGVEDMISLGDLHEAGILRNLLIRYNENLIYVSETSNVNLGTLGINLLSFPCF